VAGFCQQKDCCTVALRELEMSASYKMPAEAAPLVEWNIVQDVLVDGLAPIKDRGDRLHLAFWVEHFRYEDGQEISERSIVVRLALTPASFEAIRNQIRSVPSRDHDHAGLTQLLLSRTSASKRPS
jgi:hypothetical protein